MSLVGTCFLYSLRICVLHSFQGFVFFAVIKDWFLRVFNDLCSSQFPKFVFLAFLGICVCFIYSVLGICVCFIYTVLGICVLYSL